MEGEIARLLEGIRGRKDDAPTADSESGRRRRRRGSCRVGTSRRRRRSPPPPIPNAFEPTGWKTVWLDHISYQVSDYRRSAAFYRDLMGWTVQNDNGESQATLDINGIGGIIIRQQRAPGANAGGAAAAGARAGAAPRPGRRGCRRTRNTRLRPRARRSRA